MNQLHLYCKIVDNYGDIGVCWRLAKQLTHEHHFSVTLWIDDLPTARQLIPRLDIQQATQCLEGITIRAWHTDADFEHPAPVVIEAFGCGLPDQYQALMQPDSIWINLEYLSAEPWIEEFHGQHSRLGSLTRHFYFPGFTEHSGGLIREHDAIDNSQKFAFSDTEQQKFFTKLALPTPASNTRKISLFSYPNAPIKKLLAILAADPRPSICYVPNTTVLPVIAEFFKYEKLNPGDVPELNQLRVCILPFLSQSDYDKLLAICDINFVRGEDSWVRAIWAQKPFIWQPYVQSENTHLVKLDAFLQRYFSGINRETAQIVRGLYQQWSQDTLTEGQWAAYNAHIETLRHFHAHRAQQLAAHNDLATNLVIYIEKLKVVQL